MPSSTQHITKAINDTSKRRRFQPPITTFFSATTSESNDNNDNDCATSHNTHYHYSAATFSPVPAVPVKVQSSLLNVGMRVRKSVAEGYKTLGVKDEKPTYRPEPKQRQPVRRYPSTTSRGELAPFCGSSKTGDFAVQPLAHPSTMDYSHNELVTDEGDAYSLPSSSQESTESLITPLNGQKRSYDSDDEMDEFADENYEPGGFCMGGVLPAPSIHGRTILAPTLGQQRRRFTSMKNQKGAGHMDLDVDDDFEEASFLRRREDVDADYFGCGYEVEMNGI